MHAYRVARTHARAQTHSNQKRREHDSLISLHTQAPTRSARCSPGSRCPRARSRLLIRCVAATIRERTVGRQNLRTDALITFSSHAHSAEMRIAILVLAAFSCSPQFVY
eukprot:6187110-Pleurochrysis_carterae.AAC.1